MAAPTRLIGAATDSWDPYGLHDVLEHVPDLIPGLLATQTYARMAKDPTLSAILAGYSLQLRRAQWQLDGHGCRPEVVRQVADDMGLPVVGDDEPGAARVRGVSWNEHLRSALLMLPFGFSCHELLAEVDDDGLARLVALADRMPWTIAQLNVDPKTGALLGVSQQVKTVANKPQIKADRLAFYVNDRQGSNWWGTSLLRSSFPAWFTKIDMMRVHSTANQRFGMGVPVMEALPGTAPSGPQMQEALELASAARVGNTAGAASPPGFAFKLIGLSGSVPATLDYIEWLDRQMVKSALMGHLELGQGGNGGSRALGDSLIDSWTLSLESIGESVCDVATRQIAARIVGWNWGDSEPVPRVTVSGIGSRREVTAESLKLLLDAGALAGDPALEQWVRREWRLPEREAPAPIASAKVPAPVAPSAATTARPRAKRKKPPGQMALFAATAEDDPEPDYAQIQQQWEQARSDLLAQWPAAAQPVVDGLADQAQAAVDADDLGLLGSLAVSAGVIAAVSLLLGAAGVGLAVSAAAGVVAEAAAQGVTVTAPDEPGADRVRQTADAIAAVIASGYASGAARAALQIAGADPKTVRDAVKAHLDELGASINGLVGDNVGALLAASQYAGRLAVLEAHPADSYVSVEANDGPSRCAPCASVNGTTYATLADALVDYPQAGSFRSCAGGSRCHGFVSPRWS